MNETRIYAGGMLFIALTGAAGLYLVAGGPSARTESLPELTATVHLPSLADQRVRAKGTVVSVAEGNALYAVTFDGRQPTVHTMRYTTTSQTTPVITVLVDRRHRIRIADPRFANRLDLAGATVEVEGRLRLGNVGDASLELDDFYVRR